MRKCPPATGRKSPVLPLGIDFGEAAGSVHPVKLPETLQPELERLADKPPEPLSQRAIKDVDTSFAPHPGPQQSGIATQRDNRLVGNTRKFLSPLIIRHGDQGALEPV